MLEYKCAWYGKRLITIKPNYTSQICSDCGYHSGPKPLAIREWTCPQCGAHHDRDITAAVNILHKGLKAVGQGLAVVKERSSVSQVFGILIQHPKYYFVFPEARSFMAEQFTQLSGYQLQQRSSLRRGVSKCAKSFFSFISTTSLAYIQQGICQFWNNFKCESSNANRAVAYLSISAKLAFFHF